MDPERREDIISATSGLSIAVNVLTAALKIAIGTIASSVAVVSEGVNNATDALTGVLTFVGTKLAKKRPDRKHPFGYGRVEYLTGLVISVLILVTGIEILTESAGRIFRPVEPAVSPLLLVLIAISMAVKFFLGIYTVRMGKKAGSAALTAVGEECRNDSFVSLITILASAIFLMTGYSLDAYAGVLTSVIVIKTGAETLFSTLSEIIGRPGEEELASELYRLIRGTEGIRGAADMMLHNYGPDAWSGSVNLEIDHRLSVGEVYALVHELQLRIMHEYRVTMVFGIYAVDEVTEEAGKLRECIAGFVRNTEHVTGFHAVYREAGTGKIYCDLVVDYERKDWQALREDFEQYMSEKYPESAVEVTVETEYV